MHTAQKQLLSIFFVLCLFQLYAKGKAERFVSMGITRGAISYQGNLQPNSFSFAEASFFGGTYLGLPALWKFSVKAGFNKGKLYADDANNRDYLKVRSLSAVWLWRTGLFSVYSVHA